MRSSTLSASALLLAGAALVKAQTFTDCNPLDKTCPNDPALGTTLTTDFTKGQSSDYTYETATVLTYGSNGAEFSISKALDAPTIYLTDYIFFGKIDVTLRAAPGVGIVSSFILESDDLDEIDWEWLGGNDGSVESNFFGKGNTTLYNRAEYHNVADPIGSFHTYTINWTSESIQWLIDGNLVRTLAYGDALALGGKNYPQTPCRVKMGNWVGCADAAAASNPATQGTCQWAGGPADFSKAPFVMYVKEVVVQDYGCATEYKYGDNSGSWQSIQSVGGCSGGSKSGSGSGSSSSSSSSSGSSAASSASSTSTKASTNSAASTATTASSTPSMTTAASSAPTSASASVSASKNGTVSVPSMSTTKSSSPTAPPQESPNAAPKHYGAVDMAVMALGLGLGYLVM